MTELEAERIIPHRWSVDTQHDLQKQILQILEKHGAMTRDDLCAALGFTEKHDTGYWDKNNGIFVVTSREYDRRSTVYDAIAKLMARNVVGKRPVIIEGRGKGRPRVAFYVKN